MRAPFKHQLEGIEFLKQKRKAILADQMGLGKTMQAIIAAGNAGNKTLVLCPASLKTNWAREIIEVNDHANIVIVNGSKALDHNVSAISNKKWLILNYDIAHKEENRKLISEFKPDTVILDEAHYIKSPKTKRTKATLDMVKSAANVYLLTGTPILNRPEELFTLLKAINHPLGQDWYKFVFRFCGAFWRETSRARFLDTGGATNLLELQTKIKDSYLRRTKDILGTDLPEKIITNLQVEISAADWKKYSEAWDAYLDYLRTNPVVFEDMNDRERLEKMENIMLARHLIELNKLKQVTSLAKIDRIVEDAENIVEQGEKIIIFTQYTETLRRIREEFSKRKIIAVTLSGEDDARSRQLSIDAFQNNPNVKIFIGNIKAAGVGITLTQASTVIFADTEWTPALHEQAEDRAHRIGQKKLVNIYYYIAKNTIEEEIIDLLGKKNQIINSILDGSKKRVQQINIASQLIKKLSPTRN